MDLTTFLSLIIQVLVGMSQKSLFHKPEDCYFCVTDASGHSYKTRKHITYADLSNVMKSQKLDSMEESCANNVEFEELEALDICEDKDFILSKGLLKKNSHKVCNLDFQDLSRDLCLSRRQSEMLASRLKQWNLVEDSFKVTHARNDDRLMFREVFKAYNDNLVYCSDVNQLFKMLDHSHIANEWRLFIDGSYISKYKLLV